jgi:hypothetical protein
VADDPAALGFQPLQHGGDKRARVHRACLVAAGDELAPRAR